MRTARTHRLVGALAAFAGALAVAAPGAHAVAQSCCLDWGEPGQIQVAPGGDYVYVADYAVTLALRRDATGALSLVDSYDGGALALEMSADGRFLYGLSHAGQPGLRAWARDAGTGRLTEVGRWPARGWVGDLQLSPDGAQLYVTDPDAKAMRIYDRDGASGALTLRGELTGLARPASMALPGDGRWLYVGLSEQPYGVAVFERGADGGLRPAPEAGTTETLPDDLSLVPGDRQLMVGPPGPTVLDRNPDTGRLTPRETQYGPVSSRGDELADGNLAISADGASAYSIDRWTDRMYQLAISGGAVSVRRVYREVRDAPEGIRKPRSVTLSPDGSFLYLGAYPGTSTGMVTTFRRDTATGDLTYVSTFRGPRAGGDTAPTLAINGGAKYTRSREVTLSIHGEVLVMGIEVSNDGGFDDAIRFQGVPAKLPWTLASSGPERLPKTVYVRVYGPGDWGVISDDIILDERPPSIASVARRGARLRVRARDNLSGVKSIQIAGQPRRPGKWRRFTSKPAAGRGMQWVRVRDGAGNPSRWRRIGGAR